MNRIALITGASRGLGATLARFLAGQHYDVLLTARDAGPLEAFARSLDRAGGRVAALAGDVADPGHRRRLADAAASLGGLDLLVNNASTLGPTPLAAARRPAACRARGHLRRQCRAPLGLIQAALPLLEERGGLVVNVSSDAAIGGYPGWGGYGASKAALDLMSLTLANELSERGVGVVAVDPGDMRTGHAPGRLSRRGHLRPADAGGDAAVLRLAARPGAGADLRSALRRAGRGVGAGGMKVDVPVTDWQPGPSAVSPPEARGLDRDGVRLMVSRGHIHEHATFRDLPELLAPGTLLVVNASATLPASLSASARFGSFVLNLSTRYGERLWLAEPRWSAALEGPVPLAVGEGFEVAGLPARVLAPFPGIPRLLFVAFEGSVERAMADEGEPIRYDHVSPPYPPLSAYQTVFSDVPGSAEMPSAGRPFTPALLDALRRRSIGTVAVELHTGVSSLEGDQAGLLPEAFSVPAETARAINQARASGRAVIAVGTTVVRALETAWDGTRVRPAEGFTRLFVHAGRPVRSVDGLITGFHDPTASHIAMLEAVGGTVAGSRRLRAGIAPRLSLARVRRQPPDPVPRRRLAAA